MPRESTILFPSHGRCIYCGDDQSELSDEHIVPYALDGHYVIEKASCGKCATHTCRAENTCLNIWMKPARTSLKMSSRRKRRSDFPLRFLTPEGEREETLPIEAYPASLTIIAPPPPTIIRDLFPPHAHDLTHVWLHGDGENLEKVQQRTPTSEKIEIGGFDQLAYARMMAKIGHSYTVSVLGLDGFRPFLLDLICERSDNFNLFVGGEPFYKPKTTLKHHMQLNRPMIDGKQYAVVAIQLFAKFGAPVFQVVVGQIKSAQKDGWAIQKSPYT